VVKFHFFLFEKNCNCSAKKELLTLVFKKGMDLSTNV